MKTRTALGKAIKEIRAARNLTQEDFSLVSSRTYLSTLERGVKSPTLDKIESLSATMKVHPLTLLTLAYMRASGYRAPDDMFKKVRGELEKFI